jgi:hypothetical protein
VTPVDSVSGVPGPVASLSGRLYMRDYHFPEVKVVDDDDEIIDTHPHEDELHHHHHHLPVFAPKVEICYEDFVNERDLIIVVNNFHFRKVIIMVVHTRIRNILSIIHIKFMNISQKRGFVVATILWYLDLLDTTSRDNIWQ